MTFKFGHIDMEKESNPVHWDKKYDIDGLNAKYADRGGWEGHTRKFLVEQAIPRALKALNE